MIGSLAGLLVHKLPPALLVEVGGVGYELEAPMSTFYNLPPVGQPVRLLTHLVVREDAHILYGFGTTEERQLFRSLLKVSGVGPRIALAMLTSAAAIHTPGATSRCGWWVRANQNEPSVTATKGRMSWPKSGKASAS